MNEVKQSLLEKLMNDFKAGWPEYCEDPAQDHTILQLAKKVAIELKLDPNDIASLERVGKGITNIATFCRSNVPWCFKNVYYANMCFAMLYNHMKSVARLKAIRSQDYNFKK